MSPHNPGAHPLWWSLSICTALESADTERDTCEATAACWGPAWVSELLHSSRDGDSTACQEHLLQFWADLTVKSIFSLHLIKMSMLLLRPLPREEFRYHPLCEHPGKESS